MTLNVKPSRIDSGALQPPLIDNGEPSRNMGDESVAFTVSGGSEYLVFDSLSVFLCVSHTEVAGTCLSIRIDF